MSDRGRAFFDAIARRYDRVYALRGDASKKEIARALTLIENKTRVLVLGVGTGRELSALLDAGHAPKGLDFSREMLALCNHRTRKIPLIEADFWEPLPLEDASFDAALALHGTIAHAANPATLSALARELARVLARRGILVAEVPTRAMLAHMPSRVELDDGRAMSVAGDELTHEDTVLHVSIGATLYDQAIYEQAFAEFFDVVIEPMQSGEVRLIATKR